MRANSLALRLFVSATAVTAVILLVTGLVLSSLYRHAVERTFDDRLGVYLRTLVGELNPPGRQQNKKRRPTLPICNTLLPYLRGLTPGRVVRYNGRALSGT